MNTLGSIYILRKDIGEGGVVQKMGSSKPQALTSYLNALLL